MSNVQIEKFEKFLNEREPRERLGLLILGCTLIATLWYLFIEKPLMQSRIAIQQETLDTEKELSFFTNESNAILMQSMSAEEQKKTYNLNAAKYSSLNIRFASPQGRDFIVNALLKPQREIKIVSMKSVPFTASKIPAPKSITPATPASAAITEEGYEVVFQSDFINTVNFLEKLENLPWCLSWDSLEYIVQSYPTGQIKLDLHVVSA
jgi:MSHA biogenesis protein MshJ